MTVTEALKILGGAPKDQPPFRTLLACGFTPLHLRMFLGARLQQLLYTRTVDITTGLYGNLPVSLEQIETSGLHAIACAIEWPDLDPRFSYREAGNWNPGSIADIVQNVRETLHRIAAALQRVPAGIRIAISLPTLPLPPLFHQSGWQAGEAELLVEQSLAEFALRAVERRGTVMVNARRLGEDSPPNERMDLKSDLATGLPYTQTHADTLASAFAKLLAPPAAKKGIISDLDDTLWLGLVGEVGPEKVAWDLAGHAQVHGLYQKLLASLAEAGILIAIASKNDRAVVSRAFERSDLLLRPNQIFPTEVHWNAKSGSIERILQAWNIDASSVIFVDDSPMELSEAASVHPGLTCLQFPTNQPQAAMAFLRHLRDLCGKERISEDDGLRLESLRRASEIPREVSSGTASESFFEAAESTITLDFDVTGEDSRALELVNKTNQFNINGVRLTEADWNERLSRRGAVTLAVSYEDRFGPLGKIAVLQGSVQETLLTVNTWVMSCRAFARRIEYQCLRVLFDRYGVDGVAVSFMPTAKNGPTQEFLGALSGQKPVGQFIITRDQFREKCPPLYHQVCEMEKVS